MKYKIKITYDTGDSFHTECGLETELEEEYSTLELAEENLTRIKEHYVLREAQDEVGRRWFSKDDKRKAELEKIIAEAKNKPWYVEKHPDICIKLLLNNRKEWQISAFWCGYFEHLQSAEIIQVLPKVTFR